MATSNIKIDEGTTTQLATNTISEDAATKHLSRAVINTSAGVESGTTASPWIVEAAGTIAHDAADSGKPVKVGGVARQTNPTAVADADRVNATFDDIGRQVVVLNQVRDLVGNQVTTITSSTTETTVVTAGAAGVFHDLTHLSMTNKSATATIVTLKDATAGTTRGIWNLAAGGGVSLNFPTPKTQAAAANNWTITCGTSVDSVYVVAEYVKNV